MPLFGAGANFVNVSRKVKSFFPFEFEPEQPAKPEETEPLFDPNGQLNNRLDRILTSQDEAVKEQAKPQPQTQQAPKPQEQKPQSAKPSSGEDKRSAVDVALPMIKGYEEFRPVAYLDRNPKTPVWTVGYGTVNRVDGTKVKENDTMTEEDALKETRAKLDSIYNYFIKTYPGFQKLNNRQQAAYIDIEYNSGSINAEGSPKVHAELMKENPDLSFLENEIPSYRKSGDKINKGLVNRRVDTLNMWRAQPGWVWTQKWDAPKPKK